MTTLYGAQFSNQRYMALEAFDRIRRQAGWLALFRKLTGSPASRLQAFFAAGRQPERRYLGLKDIPVAQITGSLNRSEDFDAAFRPLKSHLRGRWADIYLQLREDRWPPVIVFKAGEQYFVEDGHHRVSVARSVGMAYIQAEVWEIPVQSAPAPRPAKVNGLQAEPCCAGLACQTA